MHSLNDETMALAPRQKLFDLVQNAALQNAVRGL